MPRLPLRRSVTAIDDHHAADAAVRDEVLGAVEDPAVARRDGRRAHAGRVAAGARLGQPPRAEHLARRRAAAGTAASARRCRTCVMCAVHSPLCAATDSAIAGIDARQLLDADAVVDRRHARRRRTPRRTGCPSARGRRASAAASMGKCCASSHSMTCGRISASANSRTLRRRSSCSSVRRKSITSNVSATGSSEMLEARWTRMARGFVERGSLAYRELHAEPMVVRALLLSSPVARRRADITAFLGVEPDARQSAGRGLCRRHGPADRRLRGRVREHERRPGARRRRGCKTFMFNGLVQTPVPIAGMQFYGTAGGGGLSARRWTTHQETQRRAQRRAAASRYRSRAAAAAASTTGCSRCGAVRGTRMCSGSTRGST